MNNIVISTVGLCGTGKSEVSNYIKEKFFFHRIYFGGFVLEEIKKRNLEINNLNEKIVRENLRERLGMAAMAIISYEEILRSLSSEKNVIIDGLYSFSEYEFLKEKLQDSFFLLALHSRKAIRYERLKNREIRSLSKDEVDQRDYFEIKNLEKANPIVLADFHIINDGSMGKLFKQTKEIMKLIL